MASQRVIECSFITAAAMTLLFAAPSAIGAYHPGPPPETTVPGEVACGQGLGLNNNLLDEDLLLDGVPETVLDPEVRVVEVTIIDPCGNPTTFYGDDWREWAPNPNGTYHVRVTVDDNDPGQPYQGQYADDPANTLHFTVTEHIKGVCSSCSPCDGGAPGAEVGLKKSVWMLFPLGTTTDGKAAGALWVHEKKPSPALSTPASVQYDLVADDVSVYPYGSNDEFQVETPQLLADVVYINDYQYEIRFYDSPDNRGPWSGDHYDQTGLTPFKEWVVQNPDGASAYDRLHVTKYVDDGSGNLIVRVKYEFDGTVSSRDWTLTTKDDQGTTLRLEEVAWVAQL